MDPQHRDRIAFMRLVSGTFKRGMKLTPSALGKPIAIHSPILFFRSGPRNCRQLPSRVTSSAFPTMARCALAIRCREKNDLRFTGLPNFAPEILRRVVLKDPTKTKQLRKALDDL